MCEILNCPKDMYNSTRLLRKLGYSEAERRETIKGYYSFLGRIFGEEVCLENTLKYAAENRLNKEQFEKLLEKKDEELGERVKKFISNTIPISNLD